MKKNGTVDELWERVGAFEENAVSKEDMVFEEDVVIDETYFEEEKKSLPQN